MAKRQRKETSATKWLKYHQQNFATLTGLFRSEEMRRWARDGDVACAHALGELDANSKLDWSVATARLELPACASFDGNSDGRSLVYVTTHADIVGGQLDMASTKIGIISAGREVNAAIVDEEGMVEQVLCARVTLDHEFSGKAKTFPFHVQFGKKAKEVTEWKEAYDVRIDEPRIPTIPLDVFYAIEIVSKQFMVRAPSMLDWRQDLDSGDWQGCLLRSTELTIKWTNQLIRRLRTDHGLDAIRGVGWNELLL